MSKLQKKCFFASAGTHALLFLVLLVGPAFLMTRDTVDDDMPTLDFIPSKLIDEKLYRLSAPTPQQSSTPPKVAPKEVVRIKPVPPAPPKPAKSTPKLKQEPKYTKAEDIDLSTATRKKSVSRPIPKPVPTREFADASRAINALAAKPSIQISTSGGQSYANYAQMVKSVYEKRWHPPDETSRDDAVVKVQIVVAKDGSIRSARIIGHSGDGSVDASVDATLRRVTKLPPFPAGAKESKRTFTIGFNLKARRSMM